MTSWFRWLSNLFTPEEASSDIPQSTSVPVPEASSSTSQPTQEIVIKPLFNPVTFEFGEEDTYVILDLETTGLDYRTEGIIEIGAVKAKGHTIIDTFHTLINPEQPIRHSSQKIHHISQEMVAEAPTMAEVLPTLLQFIGQAPIVAHNVLFDYSFLNQACKVHLKGKRFTNHRVDTQEMFRVCFQDEHSHGLSAMLARFGLESHVAHRALDDALALAQVFPRLRQLYEQHISWASTQFPNMSFLFERYLRLQRSVQVMQAEMADLKETFKLYFHEGGMPIEAVSGETLLVSKKRQYEYNEVALVSYFKEEPYFEELMKPNMRVLEKWLYSSHSPLTEEQKAFIHSQKIKLTESSNIQVVKPSAPKSPPSEHAKRVLPEENTPTKAPETEASGITHGLPAPMG
ncbi:MAG: PolC-type DNA polymerase III [Vampirovibrionales bacterium]